MTRLVVEGVSKRFLRQYLFKDIGFVLEGGSSIAVTGANGSGKSTLLRMLAGVMSPTKGIVRLTVDGHTVSREDHSLSTGLVAPYLEVYDGFSARENLTFIGQARRLGHADKRIDELLEQVGLRSRAGELVKNYSSGMKQRLKVATALLMKPPLLLMDEPSTNLDLKGIEVVKTAIQAHIEMGGLLVLATNMVEEVGWCDTSLSIEDYKKPSLSM